MDQVGGSDIGRADTTPLQHQQTHNVVGLATEFDHEFVMLRQDTREKIFEYLGRRTTDPTWWPRLPDLVRQLEEILFRRYPNKRDYHNMTKEPSERHFLFALTILSAQHQEVEQTQQLLRHIAFSGGYGTMTLTQGVTQGANENSGMSYVPYNMGPSVGASLVPQSTNMGTSQSGTYAHNEHVNTELSLGMNPTHHSSRVSNNNHVTRMVDTSETNRILSMVSPPPPVTVEEVPNEPKFICPVCLHEIADASSTICGHIFCKECIRASIKAQKKCPTCRTKLNLRNIHRVHLPTMD
ncbi:probable histone acetyltransferase HAC-like 1 [Lolium perenne]|uniref:probable histone acetyltransferase HAC-like 1 n=1 Tax=Lolium perenne TaxID=4522 RepID=UPI0021F52DA9|nr:probable histone acetyltransferase HAC-like 1 [Lolium perenne]